MPDEVYECLISGNLAGQFVQTVLNAHVDVTSAQNPYLTAEDLANTLNLMGGLMDVFCGACPSDYLASSLRVKRVYPTGGPTFIILASDLETSGGLRSGTISASQVNPVIVWITDLLPSVTGRTFIPGVSEADIDAMVYTSAFITAMTTFKDFWVAGGVLGDSGFAWEGAVYRRAKVGPPIVPHTYDLIGAARISPVVGTQRRRLHPV